MINHAVQLGLRYYNDMIAMLAIFCWRMAGEDEGDEDA